jgi:hypothetical protein
MRQSSNFLSPDDILADLQPTISNPTPLRFPLRHPLRPELYPSVNGRPPTHCSCAEVVHWVLHAA